MSASSTAETWGWVRTRPSTWSSADSAPVIRAQHQGAIWIGPADIADISCISARSSTSGRRKPLPNAVTKACAVQASWMPCAPIWRTPNRSSRAPGSSGWSSGRAVSVALTVMGTPIAVIGNLAHSLLIVNRINRKCDGGLSRAKHGSRCTDGTSGVGDRTPMNGPPPRSEAPARQRDLGARPGCRWKDMRPLA